MQRETIKTITDSATQGYSEPYRCTSEEGSDYYVKGLRSSRKSQIKEWLCANIAVALDLPIAPFCILDVPEYLYEELSGDNKKIGMGACFGSKTILDVSLLEISDAKNIDIELQTKIVAFDWLIKNGDRTLANPNLLYQANHKKLIVIDHNLAFDEDLSANDFKENHIFKNAFQSIFTDCVVQAEMNDFLFPALQAYQSACDNLPSEWMWLNNEQDLPTNYNFNFAKSALERLTNGQLWRMT